MTSRGIHIWVSAIMEPLGSLIWCKFQPISIAVHKSLAILFDLIMDISQENCNEDLDSLSKDIRVLSEYAKGLETHVKRRYLQKISLVGVDPASIPSDQFDPECLPSIEATDLVSYLVLETSYYTSRESAPFPEDEWPTRKHLGYHWKRRNHLSTPKCCY